MGGAKKAVDKVKDRHDSGYVKSLVNPLYGDFTDSASNPTSNMRGAADEVVTVFEPDIPEPEEQPVIPIPDESLQANESRKRRARRASTGRQSTRLTEGLGG